MYYFGIYHWRKHLGSITLLGVAAVLALSTVFVPWPGRPAIAAVAIALGAYGAVEVRPLFRPRPWSLDRRKYDALADLVPVDPADDVLDVGCGTGRSLVGLAPSLEGCESVTAVDRFDDRIIRGNTPGRARRNATAAGIDVELVAGDATDLPFEDDAYDVVTVSMVLHDLPERDIRAVLAELRRVCAPGGTIGLLELPIVDDRRAVSPEYWRETVSEAGFDVREARTRPWKGDRSYAALAATPQPAAADRVDEADSIPAAN